ncbi:MAG: TldD/PmbA family protein [Cyclobacteriaceae bacterium]
MKRRDFVRFTGLGMGSMLLPISSFGSPTTVEAMLDSFLDITQKNQLADAALNTAKASGATYADIRIGRYLNQFINTREDKVEGIQNIESFGAGVRAIVNGTWGFAATSDVTADGIKTATLRAVAIAMANSKCQREPVKLAPAKSHGQVKWATPIKKNAFEVPISEKVDLLLRANAAALKNGASFVNSDLFIVNEQKFFASTDGSFIDQDIHRIWPTFTVSVIDKASGKFKFRQAMSAPMGMGYEYLMPENEGKMPGLEGMIFYRNSYDIVEDAAIAAKQAREKITAKSVVPGKYDLVLEPNHLGLTIHESVGHPLELDRILGYEANYAGTSFVSIDKVKSGTFNYGSKLVNIFADKTQPRTLGAAAYDDEGVGCKRWDLIKDGILVDLQAIRDQAHILGHDESHGCCYAQSWSDVQFQRMPNVSLAPGKEAYSYRDMIKDVEKGIFIAGRGSYSIDQQRYNFQFGGNIFYEIKNGQIIGMLNDVAYQSNTQEFWNSCVKICDENDYRLFGSFFDGKGQPSQLSAVSHGSSTARFNGVNVINTGRTL